MSPFSLFEACVALIQLILLALLCRVVYTVRRQCMQPEFRVHVLELAEVAYSLNAMRTHLYQIGRVLKQRREINQTPSGSLDIDACFSSDGSFNDKKKEN